MTTGSLGKTYGNVFALRSIKPDELRGVNITQMIKSKAAGHLGCDGGSADRGGAGCGVECGSGYDRMVMEVEVLGRFMREYNILATRPVFV